MNPKKLAVFFTAYNEANVIGDVLDRVAKGIDIYVIDDGSVDNTIQVCKQRGVRVIRHPVNIGQGNAVITMFKLAVQTDYQYIAVLDADGQHDASEIPRFIEALEESGADIAQGSRVIGQNYKKAPWARKAFLGPLTYFLNRLTGFQLTDSMCGFRAYRVHSLKKIQHIFNDFKEPEYMASEVWIKFSRAGFSVVEVPIALSERKYGISYKGLFRYGWGVISTILRSRLDLYKDHYKTIIPGKNKNKNSDIKELT
jgi:glycosyltransferase involved in cell wall biosynthesis